MFKADPVSADALLYGNNILQTSVSIVTSAMNLLQNIPFTFATPNIYVLT
ncbi:hypothetical protein BAN44_0004 [Bacillus anthracis]|nr:hypothetical protein BAN44_0004 [Bacillus anthracis]GAO62754.1 hypothetical protein BA5240_0004 [Bacillus anthracis]